MDATGRPRRVFVLGQDAAIDVEPVARRVVAEGAELVLLSLGYPVAPGQEAAVAEALRLTAELRLWLDALLVPSPDRLSDFVFPGDEVVVVASGSERRRIERVLARTGARVRRQPLPVPARLSVPVSVGAPERLDLQDDDNGVVFDEPTRFGSESIEALAGREVAQPDLDTVWTREDALARKAAALRVYLGAAPGVGKTFAMLGEGQRRRARGTDVVVGVVETYGRPRTVEMLDGLDVLPPMRIDYRGSLFDELDADALVARHPEVALIDELAHTNVPGSRRAKRWEDVLDMLAAGIDVITTLNVQHLASLNDVVANITGIRQQETVPDWVLDLADQVELVDMSPHALQRRMVHGNVYPDARKAELALQRFFTLENLTALRELALMRVANQVDDELLRRWSRSGTPETRERILVCVEAADVAETLVRRGGRIAQRAKGDLLVVHADAGEHPGDDAWLERIRALAAELGGELVSLPAEDPVEAILAFAYQQHVTQLVVGESLRSRWQQLLKGSFVDRLIRRAADIDVHVIARRER